MKTTIVIGICGRAEAGKSTLAKELILPVFSFAEPVKRMLKELGLTDAQLYGDEKETPCEALLGNTPRRAMRTLGTEWGREMISEDLWVHQFVKKVQDCKFNIVVCDDVRFVTEIEAIRKLGGFLVEVRRPAKPEGFWLKLRTKFLPKHPSESVVFESLGIPHIINDGTPRDLRLKLLKLLDVDTSNALR